MLTGCRCMKTQARTHLSSPNDCRRFMQEIVHTHRRSESGQPEALGGALTRFAVTDILAMVVSCRERSPTNPSCGLCGGFQPSLADIRDIRHRNRRYWSTLLRQSTYEGREWFVFLLLSHVHIRDSCFALPSVYYVHKRDIRFPRIFVPRPKLTCGDFLPS